MSCNASEINIHRALKKNSENKKLKMQQNDFFHDCGC